MDPIRTSTSVRQPSADVVLARLRAGLARIGHPAHLDRDQVAALAGATRLPLDAAGDGIAQVSCGAGASIRFDASTATMPAGERVAIGAAPSAHAIAAQRTIGEVLRTTPLRVALSGGKDSSVVMALVLNAARELVAAGERPAPIHVTSADTGVESPEVLAQLAAIHASIEAFAETLGIDVHVHVTRPTLMQRWWVRILAGRKLPSYAGAQADCTVDMKVKPQERLATHIKARLTADGWPAPVTVTGMRRAESARRQGNMDARGDGDAGERARGMLAPIAHWSDAQVFDFLGSATEPKFPHDWASLLEFYANASTECVLAPDPETSANAPRCGTRSGCFVCQQTSDDHSAAALATQPGYEYLEPLVRLNRYLRAIRWDFERRHWIGRNIDPLTGHVAIHPNCFSFGECDRLLRMVLTLDVDERSRAARIAAKLKAGTIADTARNRRLATPQFCNVSLEDLIAIDFFRSVDAFGPEHSALMAYDDVVRRGQREPVLVIDPVPRTAVPPQRFAPLDLPSLTAVDAGFQDVTMMIAEVGSIRREDPVTGRLELRHAGETDTTTFDIDAEGIDLFFAFEAGDRLRAARAGTLPACDAARYYLRLGTVHIPRGKTVELDAQLRRSISKAHAGLLWNADRRRIASIGVVEHEALRRTRAEEVLGARDIDRTERQRVETNRAVAAAIAPTPAAIDPLALLVQRLALADALAAGVARFAGRSLERDLRRVDAHLRAVERRDGISTRTLMPEALAEFARARRALEWVTPDDASPYSIAHWLVLAQERKPVAPRHPQQTCLQFDTGASP